MERQSLDEYYLNIALAVSKRSTCLRRQYGAVIVNNGEIVATGYNGSARGEVNCIDKCFCQRQLDGSQHNDGNYANCPAVHAEMNAMLSASRVEMLGGTLYLAGYDSGNIIVDCKPCAVCQRMIKNSGLTVVTHTED